MPIAQLCRQFRSKSKFKNLPVCHSSYKVCGPIYCEMKNRNRTSKRRHQDACIGRSGHSQIAIQNSKFKNLPLFLNTNPDPLRRTPGVICFHDWITFSIRQENRHATRDAPLTLICAPCIVLDIILEAIQQQFHPRLAPPPTPGFDFDPETQDFWKAKYR